MLVESALAGAKVEYVVVGIGINVLMRSLPEDVAEIATSLALERDARAPSDSLPALDRALILADVLAGLERDVELVAHKGLGPVHPRLTRHDALLGRAVESAGEGNVRGIAAGVDLDGRLLVRGDDGILTHVSSGEVRFRLS